MFATLVGILAFFLLYLGCERFYLNRLRQAIPLRIAITGTRGKSGLVRMITAMLRCRGLAVMGKTTGSAALYLMPGGAEVAVPRRGLTTILEQIKMLRAAARAQAKAVVAEVMSIEPENHLVEGCQILQPHIVVLTNCRPDHCAAMGATEVEVASVLALTIPPKATVFVTAESSRPNLFEAIKAVDGQLHIVPSGHAQSLLQSDPRLTRCQFGENIDLLWALAQHLGIDREHVRRGIAEAGNDIGSFKIWRLNLPGQPKEAFFVNGFAANDPLSTRLVMEKADAILGGTYQRIGLFSLRADRPDRSLHWLTALKDGASGWFDKLYLLGGHARAVQRSLKQGEVLHDSTPAAILEQIFAHTDAPLVIFGCVNIKGVGAELVQYCSQHGAEYGC